MAGITIVGKPSVIPYPKSRTFFTPTAKNCGKAERKLLISCVESMEHLDRDLKIFWDIALCARTVSSNMLMMLE